ncbi:sigma factor [Actinomadura sp. GTD37]|uniref:sigma factor n=1 Tax=Actinomadura sp. GTD37 TaxID=1778030 RepID=UPI0035C17472
MDDEQLAERFEANRPRLAALAYRMLGSPTEAHDAVQEAWLRLSRTNADRIENLNGWLTTIVAHICIDMLRTRTSAAKTRSTNAYRSR